MYYYNSIQFGLTKCTADQYRFTKNADRLCQLTLIWLIGRHHHIVPCGKFHRIVGAPHETFPNVKYDAPEEVGGDSKCFDSPIRK